MSRYQKYVKRLMKTKKIFQGAYRFRGLIISLASVGLVLTGSYMATKGLIVGDINISPSFVYGEEVIESNSPRAVLANIDYEYRTPNGEWTTAKPTIPGTYEVRAVSKNFFGKSVYSKVKEFEIKPKEITIFIDDNEISYGKFDKVNYIIAEGNYEEIPDPGSYEKTTLVSGDQLNSFDIDFDRDSNGNIILETNAKIDDIVIKNQDDQNVTSLYNIHTPKRSVKINQANLSIAASVENTIYNGEEVSYLENTIYTQEDNPSLSSGDYIEITSSHYEDEDGEIVSSVRSIGNYTAIIDDYTVFNESGEDVTSLYNAEVINKTFSITQKEGVHFYTASGEKSYDNVQFVIDDIGESKNYATDLVSGDYIKLDQNNNVDNKNVGTYPNLLSFKIYRKIDEVEVDVTNNYLIDDNSYTYGTLNVLPRYVDVSFDYDNNKTYDGKGVEVSVSCVNNLEKNKDNTNLIDLFSININLQYYGYDYENLKYTYFSNNEVIDVGEYQIIVDSVQIFDKANQLLDSSNFVFEVTNDNLVINVNKRNVTLKPKDAEVTFDNSSHTLDEIEILNLSENEGLLDSHTVSFNTNEIVYVDENKDGNISILEYKIINQDNKEVTRNYNVTLEKGTLTINKLEIAISFSSENQFTYDGQEHTFTSYEFINDSKLYEGHELFVELSKVKNVSYEGDEVASIKIEVLSWSINNNSLLTNCYSLKVDEESSKMTINPKEILIKPEDVNAIYDGLTHTAINGETIGSSNLLSGHNIFVTSTNNSEINVCENRENQIASYIIKDENGIDVTKNYKVVGKEIGYITITKRPITLQSESATFTYDGQEHHFDNYQVLEGSLVPSHVLSFASASFKDVILLDGNVISMVNEYNNVKIAYNEEVVTDNYEITIINGDVLVNQKIIYVKPEAINNIYSGSIMTARKVSSDTSSQLVEGHHFDDIISDEFINAGKYENYVSLASIRVLDEEDVDQTSNYHFVLLSNTVEIIKKDVTIKASDVIYTYDGQEHDSTIGEVVSGSIVDTHQVFVTTSKYVDVISNGSLNILGVTIVDEEGNNVTSNYNVTTSNSGLITINKRHIEVSIFDVSFVYDGKSHSLYDYELVSGELVPNQIIKIESSTSFINASENNVEVDNSLVKIYENGINKASNYDIALVNDSAKITINKRNITIKPQDYEGVYDGVAHPIIYGEASNLVEGQYITLQTTFDNQIIPTGAVQTNNILDGTVKIYDQNHEIIDLNNYNITFTSGSFNITKRPIIIEPEALEAVYNGQIYSVNRGITSSSSLYELVENHYIELETTRSITNVGQIDDNRIVDGSIIIYDKEGNVVTDYYDIVGTLSSSLVVYQRELQIETSDLSFVYDGNEHVLDSFITLEDQLVYSHIISYNDTFKYVKDSNNNFELDISSFIIRDKDGNEVTSNYKITLTNSSCEVEVLPREITLKPQDEEVIYDGNNHTLSNYELVSSSLVSGDYINSYSSDDYFTNVNLVGNSVLPYEVSFNPSSIVIYSSSGEDITDNYSITLQSGKLLISQREISIKPDDVNAIYSGEEVKATSGTATNLVDGHYLIVLDTSVKIINVKDSSLENYILENGYQIYDESNNDVTNNYKVKEYLPGEIIITPLQISVKPLDVEVTYDGTVHTTYQGETTSSSNSLVSDNQYIIIYPTIKNQKDVCLNLENNIVEGSVKIYDNEGNLLTDNYSITLEKGYITIYRREISIKPLNVVEVYNGKSHYVNNVEFISSSLASSHRIEVTTSLEVTNVWESSEYNEIVSYIIYDESGIDVTSNYLVSTDYGSITVTQLSIDIAPEVVSLTYDGQEHSSSKVNFINSTSLVENQFYTFTSTTRKDVCNENNIIESFKVYDKSGNDLTDNYDINFYNSTITISKLDVTIQAIDVNFTYDGKEHSSTKGKVVSGSIVDTHQIFVTTLKYVDVISNGSLNILGVTIVDEEGNNVTSNYNVTTSNSGLITINKRHIEVSISDVSFVYDGKSHSLYDYELVSGELVSNQIIKIESSPSFINASENDVEVDNSLVKIYENGINKTSNYDIALVNDSAKITISKREVTIYPENIKAVYDGASKTTTKGRGDNLLENDQVSIVSTLSPVNVGTYENSVKEGSVVITNNGVNVTDNYLITTGIGKIVIEKRYIAIKPIDIDEKYNGLPHSVTSGEIASNSTSLAKDSHRIVVTTNSFVDACENIENNILSYQILEGEEDVTNNYDVLCLPGKVTINPLDITISPIYEEVEYDGNYHSSSSLNVSTLISSHVISSFACNEVIDVNYVGEVISSYESKIDPSSITIKDSEGNDVTKNYKISFLTGEIKILPKEITIKPNYQEFIYDGESHNVNQVSSDSLSQLIEGHKFTNVSSSSFTNVGTYENNLIQNVRILDSYNNDVTGNYLINYAPNSLVILKREIENVKPLDASFEYDGLAHNVYFAEAVNLLKGHYIEITSTKEVKNVSDSTIDNQVDTSKSITIRDENGTDVTSNYQILSYASASLIIYPREIEVTTSSREFVYDNLLHSDSAYFVTNGRIVENEYLSLVTASYQYVVRGENNEVLSYLNEVSSYSFVDQLDNDVSENYIISFVYGKITINPREITLQSQYLEVMYDGLNHLPTSINVLDGSLVFGQTISSFELYETSFIDVKYISNSVSSYTTNIKAVVIEDEERELTSNYDITFVQGSLKILPREITLKVQDEELVYNGDYQQASSLVVTSTISLLESHQVEFTTTKVMNVGTYDVSIESYKIVDDGNDVTKNYLVTLLEGTLKVNKRKIEIAPSDVEETYDGQIHKANSCFASSLVESHTIEFTTYNEEQINVCTNLTNKIKIVTIYDRNHNDVTNNYSITLIDGFITILPREIAVSPEDVEVVYDGQSHSTNKGVSSSLVEGHSIYLISTKSATNVSDSLTDNIAKVNSVVIYDELGNDVTFNYLITSYLEGSITILPLDVTITPDSDEFTYDGVEHNVTTYSLSRPLINQHVLSFDYHNFIDAGEYGNAFTNLKVSDGVNDVTENYNFSIIAGKITIKPREITLKVVDETIEYQLDNYLISEVEVMEGSLVPLHRINVNPFEFIQELSSGHSYQMIIPVENIQILSLDVDVTNNYSIRINKGTLTVIPRLLVLKPKDYEGLCDGNEVNVTSYECLDGTSLASSALETITIETSKRIRYVEESTSENEITSCLITLFKDGAYIDNTSNYQLQFVKGSITIKYLQMADSGYTLVTGDDSPLHKLNEKEIAKTSSFSIVDSDNKVVKESNGNTSIDLSFIEGLYGVYLILPEGAIVPSNGKLNTIVKNELSIRAYVNHGGKIYDVTEEIGLYDSDIKYGDLSINNNLEFEKTMNLDIDRYYSLYDNQDNIVLPLYYKDDHSISEYHIVSDGYRVYDKNSILAQDQVYHPNNDHKEFSLQIDRFKVFDENNIDVTIDALKEFNINTNEIGIKLEATKVSSLPSLVNYNANYNISNPNNIIGFNPNSSDFIDEIMVLFRGINSVDRSQISVEIDEEHVFANYEKSEALIVNYQVKITNILGEDMSELFTLSNDNIILVIFNRISISNEEASSNNIVIQNGRVIDLKNGLDITPLVKII